MTGPRSNSVLGPVVGLVLVLFVALLTFLPVGNQHPQSSVFSEGERGRFGVFRAARELGLDARSWTGAPGELPGGRALLFLPDPPPEPAGYPEDGSGESLDLSSRLRDLMHYRRFLERGGTILAIADGSLMDFLRDDLELGELAGLELRDFLGGDRDEGLGVTLRSGEAFTLDWEPESRFLPSEEAETVLADGDGQILAVEIPVGRGALCLVAPRDLITRNQHVLKRENGLLFVRLLEELGGRGPIYFDEYALGSWSAGTKLGLAFSGSRVSPSVHLVLLALVALWAAAWVRGFPRDPEPLGQVSPLLRAQGFASLVAGAGRFDLLARMLRNATLRRLGRRIGLNARAVDQLEDEGGEVDGSLVERVLSRFVRDAEKGSAAREVLQERRVRTRDDLEDLARDLDRLERSIHPHGDRGPRKLAPSEPLPKD